MDVGDWLQSLGLGQYEATFRDNAIGMDILADLTEDDLSQFGVLFGDRKRLLKAIASLGPVTTVAKLPSAGPAPSSQDTAERRQLTVIFCDLVGSTAMSARLDPEDMREIIGLYHRCCADRIGHAGGFVAKYMGDGVLAYFGYPQAHEHDAERAVQAGLAIVEAAPKLVSAAGSTLHVRVGIATGLVVVGDLIGSGEAQERGVVGETPNLAARLQAIAEPDTVVIAEHTRRLLGNLFELQDLGAKDLKGIAGPARAWAALRPSSTESRFEAMHATGLTTLVGRDEEFELLLRRWSKAKSGEGQVALISGEAGIGKSRLTAALLERLVDEPHTRLRYFCSPQHTDSAFYPIIGQMERAAGLTRDDAPPTKLDKLEALLAPTSTSIEDAALFAEMLLLPKDGRYPALSLTPPQRRQRTLEALVSQVEALAREHPVLMIFEDVHWSDPTSLDAFSRTVDRIAGLRALLIVTFRPEFDAPWIGRPHVTALTLNRLARREIDALIDRVVGNNLLPASLRRDIVERTDGIPLFVEEMTKAVLEAEDEGDALRTAAAVPSPALAVPASLHASLMARLDRLGPAKEVAQIGAAIGREFSHALLAATASKPEVELRSALEHLVAVGLLSRQGVPPHASYIFKHSLVQDAAYGTLLRGPRRMLHARIAEAIEQEFADIAERQPEILARHCTEAGLLAKGASLLGRAGQRSLDRSALTEAAEHLKRAVGLIATLPATAELRREQIKLQVALITPLLHIKGYAASETMASVERARLLIEQAEALREPLEDPLLLFSVLYGLWVSNYVAFNGDALRALAMQFCALAEKQATTGPRMIGHRLMGTSSLFRGDLTEGLAHYNLAVALYDPDEHRALAVRFAQDIRVAILSTRAFALWMLGYPSAARRDTDDALKEAADFGQSGTSMYALQHAAVTYALLRDAVSASTLIEQSISLAEEKNTIFWESAGMLNKGWLFVMHGNMQQAIECLNNSIAQFKSTGSTMWMPSYFAQLALAYAGIDQFDLAWRNIDKSLAAIETTKEKCWEAEVCRIAGEIALKIANPDTAKAQEWFQRALATARAQQAKSWELRAAMSMARLWRDQGKRDAARDLLAPVYGWFTEGFDTLDLKEAKVLLDALAS